MASQTSSRYGFIDAARGIAACLVMLQHSLYSSGLLGNYPTEVLTGFIPRWLEFGETGVMTFFIVSGFVIPLSLEKTNNFKLFWLHRALRIYPLYLAIFFATCALKLGGGLDSIGAFATNFLTHLFFIQEYVSQENFVGGSWTLSLELIWYIGLSALFLISMNKKVVLLVVVGILVSISAQIGCALGHHLPMGRLSMLMCCVLGLVFYRYDRGEISLRLFAILVGAMFLTILGNLFVGMQLFPSPHPTADFRMAGTSWGLGGLIFCGLFFTRQSAMWSHGVFNFLGRISYSVYLVHGVVLLALAHTLLHGWLFVATVFAVTIGISMLTYRFIEAPPIKFGHSMGATLKARQQAAKEPLPKT